MTEWLAFALMMSVAMTALLWPVRRASTLAGGWGRSYYKVQLAEAQRDLGLGLLDPSELEAVRIESARRLLAAANDQRGPSSMTEVGSRRSVAIVALIVLPLLSTILYTLVGPPRPREVQSSERASAIGDDQSLESLVAQVEAHLVKNPTDVRGWMVLAPVLNRIGRYEDAARAYRNAIDLGNDSSEGRADLGEALTGAAGGIVTIEAKAEFEHAATLDPTDTKAQYFLGLAAEQDGRKAAAATIWRALLAKAPVDALWQPLVQSALARVGGGSAVPTLSDEAVAASQDLSEGDRGAMLRDMVERLATRLKQNGDDVDGWLRLVRAYLVMGERDKAISALGEARGAVADDIERLRRLNEGLKNLGLDG